MTKIKQFMGLVNTNKLTNHINSSRNRLYLNKNNLTYLKNITQNKPQKKRNLSEVTLSDKELNNELEIILNGFLIKENNKELSRLLNFMDEPPLDEICDWNIQKNTHLIKK